VLAPLAEAAMPTVGLVVEAVVPVVSPVVQALSPVVAVVDSVVTPVAGAVGLIVESVAGSGPGPPTHGPEPPGSSPGAVRHSGGASAGRPAPPVASPWRTNGADGDVPPPALGSVGDATAGGGAAAGGVPPGPLALALPSAAPAGWGRSGSGGNGPSVLLAALASGLLGLDLARGGVVHDRAARLAGLAGGPGCLPG
jgi:hypothetical protein